MSTHALESLDGSSGAAVEISAQQYDAKLWRILERTNVNGLPLLGHVALHDGLVEDPRIRVVQLPEVEAVHI